MILIISRDSDTSTDLVMNWLHRWNIPHLRLNEDLYNDVYIDYNKNIVKIKGIDINQVKVVWFRKFPEIINETEKDEISKKISKSVINFKIREGIAFREYLFQLLQENKNIRWLTKPFYATENKLLQMKQAEKNGLMIPGTYILTSKQDLVKLISSGDDYITKPFENCIHLIYKKKSIGMKTVIINHSVSDLPDFFPPALIQKKINRKYEVRIFYVMGKFFATRILYENSDEDVHRVNMVYLKGRFENFKLPLKIENSLQNLLNEFDLNCASIDMIIDDFGNYIFLEINPTGQFTYHSFFNNTYLEKEIAMALKKMYDSHEKQYN